MDLIAVRNNNNNNLDSNNSEERTPLRTYKRRVRRVMPDELVWEILLRLPPKTLARFKSVCRAWLAIISSPSFICMHLRQSAPRNECEPSFLIAAHTFYDMRSMPKTWNPEVPFYHWQEAGKGNASLVSTMDLPGDSGFSHCPLHCDGLVLLPTETKLYVFNPGTGDVLNLPDGQKNSGYAQAPGLGLDLGTNTYKVAQFFYRSVYYYKRTYNAGMEVFTIGGHGSCWRTVEDPPYPVIMPQEPAYFKGSLYWHIERELLQTPLQGFLRFDLEEEKFDFISHAVLPSDEQPLQFIELGGKHPLYKQFGRCQMFSRT